MKLIVQIPCLNEEHTIAEVIGDLPASIPGVDEIEVMVINDGSTDGTSQAARAAGAHHLLEFKANRGLARAFDQGLKTALLLDADIIVNTDGDHQYPGGDIPALVRPIVEGRADMVIGARPFGDIDSMSPLRRFLQRAGSWAIGRFLGFPVRDATSGFRALNREAARAMRIMSDFTYTIESLMLAGEHGLRVEFVPIGVNPKKRGSRLFKSTLGYLGRTAETLLRISFFHNPLKYFAWLSLACLAPGFFMLLRFLFFWLITPAGGQTGHTQSLVLGGALITLGIVTLLLGGLADLMAKNRRMLEDLGRRMQKMENSLFTLEKGRGPKNE